MESLRRVIKDRVMGSIDYYRDISDGEMYELIDREMAQILRYKTLTIEQKKALRTGVFDSIRKLDVLQKLLDDPSITDVRSLENIQCTRTITPKKPMFWAFLICGSSQSTAVSYLTDFNSDYM